MSGTSHIRSLSIAQEVTFGSPDVVGSTGLPDASVLTFVSMECERAPVIIAGEPVFDDRKDTRAGPYMLAPEPDTVCDVNGNAIPRRTGTITVDMVLTNVGDKTTFASIEAMPVSMLFNSVMQTSAAAQPGTASDTAGVVTSGNKFTPTALNEYTEGQGIAVNVDGKGEYSFVVDKAADIKVSPALSSNFALGDDVRIMQTYSVAPTMGNLGASLALRADGDGWRTYMVGCRPTACAISLSNHMVKLSFTVQFAHAYDDNSDASVTAGTNFSDPVIADGCVSHMLQTYTTVSTLKVNGVSSPAAMLRDTLLVDEFDATLTWTLAPQGTSENIMGVSDYEVTDFACETNLMCSAPATNSLDQQTFYDRDLHSVLIGLSAVSAGNGFCIYMPAAALFNDPDVQDFGKDSLRTSYKFKQGGPWTGDTGSTNPSSTIFRLALAN